MSHARTLVRRSQTLVRRGDAIRIGFRALRVERLEARWMLNAGDLDTSFGNGAGVLIPSSNFEVAQQTGVAVQSDGKILVAAGGGGTEAQVSLVRYNADGSLDTTFGTDGTATLSLVAGMQDTRVAQLLVGQDGTIIVEGRLDAWVPTSGTGSSASTFISPNFIAKLSPDGQQDTAFNDGTGYLLSTRASNDAIALESDGKIDFANWNESTVFGVTQFNADGSLNTSFGTNGTADASVPWNAGDLVPGVVRLQIMVDGDDRIVLAAGRGGDGSAVDVAREMALSTQIGIARFNTDGTLDASFGNGGTVFEQVGGQSTNFDSIVLDPDGTLTAEVDNPSVSNQLLLLHINSDGSPDLSFGNAGVVAITTSGSPNIAPLAVQSDGKLVLAVPETQGNTSQFTLARYNVDGSVDSTFTSAAVTGKPSSVTIEPDGNLLLGIQGAEIQDGPGFIPMLLAFQQFFGDQQGSQVASLPPFSIAGGTLNVTDTTGNDSFEVYFTDASDFVVSLQGISQTYSTSQVTTINFVGQGTGDTSIVGGELGQVQTQLSAGSGQISGAGWTINIGNSPVIWVYGDSTSTAQLFGSTSTTNTFVGGLPLSYMYGTGYNNYVVGFGSAYGYAQSAQDVAYFYSVHDAEVAMSPDYTYLASGNEAFADNFATVQAYSAGDGSDQSFLYGGKNGGDDFSTTNAYSFMSGTATQGNYFNAANDFAAAFGVGEGANDYAYFLDSSGNSHFAAASGAAGMQAGASTSLAQGFQVIYSTATVGTDAAQVLVSDAADPPTTQGNSTTLSAAGGLVQMTGFKQVTPDTTEANALAGSSDSNTAIDFVLSTLDNWSS